MCSSGVARPSSGDGMEGVADYVGRANVAAVEYIELPNWGADECPWGRELALLSHHRADHQLSEGLKHCLARVEDVRTGLTEELFLPASTRAGGTVRALSRRSVTRAQFQAAEQALPPEFRVNREYTFSELGQGSIFGANLGEVWLFVAVAASIQNLRSSKRLSERSQYPLSRVLDPHLYFLGRFYANLIIACILRASRRRDLRTVDIEPVLRRAAGERLREPESLELRTELILAMTEGKLPWPQEMSPSQRCSPRSTTRCARFRLLASPGGASPLSALIGWSGGAGGAAIQRRVTALGDALPRHAAAAGACRRLAETHVSCFRRLVGTPPTIVALACPSGPR